LLNKTDITPVKFMADQDTLICATCNTPYASTETQCPVCGEANPLVTNDLLTEEPVTDLTPGRRRFRNRSGCLIVLLFLLFFVLVLGGILLGGYEGLRDRVLRTQAEVERHYQQAQIHIEDGRLELAKAELELTLSLDPTYTEARETLEALKARLVVEITPTPTLEIRANQTNELFDEAKDQTLQGNWAEAIDILKQIRRIDPGYEITQVSDILYNANYELGLRLISEDRITDAVTAFDEALAERPNDPLVTAEWEKATLYLSLSSPDPSNFEDNLVVLNRIYSQDPDFADVADLLYETYKQYGDYLGSQDDWCLALPRYQEAAAIFRGQEVEALAAQAEIKCNNARLAKTPPTATPRPRTIGPAATPARDIVAFAAAEIATNGNNHNTGTIYFSRLNLQNSWEIRALSLPDSTEKTVLVNGAQPAINHSSNLLAYQSTAADSIGLHIFNLTTGEDVRATTFAEDVLPRWTQSDKDFVFGSQRAGDRRWQILIGFADGKGEPVVLLDGRTPTASSRNNLIAYQGTDPQGNNPGIYIVPRQGGQSQRITADQSDRSPAFSPSNNQIAFMSTRSGNWDIWVVSVSGGSPKRLTTSPTNDGLPTWSPDGTQIAFVSDRDGGWGIYTMSASGGQPQRVADWGRDHPDWLMEQLSWGQ
jgi:Tol biopolymer transport system component/tetratricopeptide (TPR) repeat protein